MARSAGKTLIGLFWSGQRKLQIYSCPDAPLARCARAVARGWRPSASGGCSIRREVTQGELGHRARHQRRRAHSFPPLRLRSPDPRLQWYAIAKLKTRRTALPASAAPSDAVLPLAERAPAKMTSFTGFSEHRTRHPGRGYSHTNALHWIFINLSLLTA